MGLIKQHRPVLLLSAITSKSPEALEWGLAELKSAWGETLAISPVFDFTETSYYEKSMGTGLKKQFLVFDKLVPPDTLPDCKILANELEDRFAGEFEADVERPINIDPGYLTEAKLVLATTKDRDHRIYLAKGIYAEVTLYFNRGEWKSRPWTYPDYQREDFQKFFTQCRDLLRKRYQQMNPASIDERDFA